MSLINEKSDVGVNKERAILRQEARRARGLHTQRADAPVLDLKALSKTASCWTPRRGYSGSWSSSKTDKTGAMTWDTTAKEQMKVMEPCNIAKRRALSTPLKNPAYPSARGIPPIRNGRRAGMWESLGQVIEDTITGSLKQKTGNFPKVNQV